MRLAPILLAVLAIFAGLLSVASADPPAAASVAQAEADNTPHVQGDADCSDGIDAKDGLEILDGLAGLTSSPCLPLGNINCDSATDIVDVIDILKFSAGLPVAPVNNCPTLNSASLRLLTVDKFGGGSINGLPGLPVCGDDCATVAVAVEDGVSVSLEATAGAASHFDSWQGCDSSETDSCRVVADGDKTILATFASDDLSLSSDTTVIPPETMNQLISVDGNHYLFGPAATALLALTPGTTVLGLDHGGLIGRVTSVASDPDGITLILSPPDEGSGITTGTVVVHDVLEPNNIQSATTLNGAIYDQPSSVGVAADDLLINIDADAGSVQITGTTHVRASVDAAVDWDLFGVKEIRYIQTIQEVTSLTLHVKAVGAVSQQKWQLAHFTFGCITIVCPSLSVNVGIEGSLSAGGQIGGTIHETTVGGVHYRRDSGWSPVQSWKRSFTLDSVVPSVELSVRPFLEFQFEALVFNTGGPYVSLQPYARLSAKPLESPWLQAFLGVRGSAGFTLDVPILHLKKDYEADLHFGVEVRVWQIDEQPSACAIEATGICYVATNVADKLNSGDISYVVDLSDASEVLCDSNNVYNAQACTGVPSGQTVNCYGTALFQSEGGCVTASVYRGILQAWHDDYQFWPFVVSPTGSADSGSIMFAALPRSGSTGPSLIAFGVHRESTAWRLGGNIQARFPDFQRDYFICYTTDGDYAAWPGSSAPSSLDCSTYCARPNDCLTL